MSITINTVLQSGTVKWAALRYDASGKPEYRFVLYRETTNADGHVFPLSIPCCNPGTTGERLADDLTEGDFIVITARYEHEGMIHRVGEEIAQLQRLIDAHQAAGRTRRVEHAQLQMRAKELREAIIPSLRRRLAEAEHERRPRRVALEQAVRLAERRVAITEQSLAGYEAELRALAGDEAHAG
jgi:predicted RNase H-like nuclease